MLSYSRIIPAKSIKGKAPSLFSSFKGASFLPPSFSGSMALEGALVLPLFLLFLFPLLYSLEIVRFQSDLYAAVHQSGSKICFYSYQDKFAQEESGNNAGTAKGEIRERLEKEILPFLCVEKGREGVVIHVEKTVSGDVRITTACSMKPFIWYLPVGDITMEDRFFGHGFVGYTGSGKAGEDEKEMFVYITPAGSRYHLTESCKYLSFHVYAVAGEELEEKRNESGGRYYPCELCEPGETGLVYLTQWGGKYHGRSDCPSIKRTVFIVPISEAGGRPPCRSCG